MQLYDLPRLGGKRRKYGTSKPSAGAKIPGYSKHIEWRMLFLAMEGVICLLRYTQVKNIRVVQVNNGELHDGFVIPGPKVCHGFHDTMKTFPF